MENPSPADVLLKWSGRVSEIGNVIMCVIFGAGEQLAFYFCVADTIFSINLNLK